jgi:hypothetical protein
LLVLLVFSILEECVTSILWVEKIKRARIVSSNQKPVVLNVHIHHSYHYLKICNIRVDVDIFEEKFAKYQIREK